ncbi:hypothetical protein ACHAXA_001920 [Cyclostephanos tholiformis]|uniref:Disease resistance R13L4/SHOC-2-like LRR domain-containing protein n=1 Tax=Cyclostephanos tholiformis TaxID=382380 RepID=A0ABD3R6A4_9STRA
MYQTRAFFSGGGGDDSSCDSSIPPPPPPHPPPTPTEEIERQLTPVLHESSASYDAALYDADPTLSYHTDQSMPYDAAATFSWGDAGAIAPILPPPPPPPPPLPHPNSAMSGATSYGGQQIELDFRPRSCSEDDNDENDDEEGYGEEGPASETEETKRTPSRCLGRRKCAVASIAALLLVAGGVVVLTLHLTGGLGGGAVGGETAVSREDVALGVIERNLPPEIRDAVIDANASAPQRDALAWMLYDDEYDNYDWEGLAHDPPDADAEFVFVQRFVVSTFYISLDGDNWADGTYWMTGKDVCDWHGIECFGSSSSGESERRVLQATARGDAIRSLALPENRLKGLLPADLVGLKHLENLEVFRNEIEGAIPSHLYNMTTLKTLFLDENKITGTISPEIGNLVNLEKFTLNRNEIVGEIPTEIGRLEELSMLWLFDNKGITGSFPSVVGQANLKSLVLFNTGISGPIPDLSNLQKLEVFKVENCALTGDGYSSLYDVPSLKVLGLAGNAVTGSLEGVGELLNLEELYISQTSIGGPLPKGIGNLNQLKYIKGSETLLTGAIPSSIGNLKNLLEFDLSQSGISGIIPSDIGALESLTTLVLSGNYLTGGLPSEVGLLSELEVLILSKNNLAGTLPSELGNLVNLAVLYLQDNLLEGKIPPELGNITSIEFMNLTNNVLTGEVPDDLCSDGATIQADCSVSCAVDCCANYEC